MAGRKVSIWYGKEGAMLEILWAFREGYFTPTDDGRVFKRLNDDGEVIGFLIHDMSTFRYSNPVEFELASEEPVGGASNITPA